MFFIIIIVGFKFNGILYVSPASSYWLPETYNNVCLPWLVGIYNIQVLLQHTHTHTPIMKVILYLSLQ